MPCTFMHPFSCPRLWLRSRGGTMPTHVGNTSVADGSRSAKRYWRAKQRQRCNSRWRFALMMPGLNSATPVSRLSPSCCAASSVAGRPEPAGGAGGRRSGCAVPAACAAHRRAPGGRAAGRGRAHGRRARRPPAARRSSGACVRKACERDWTGCVLPKFYVWLQLCATVHGGKEGVHATLHALLPSTVFFFSHVI